MLTKDIIESSKITPTENVSSLGYDRVIEGIIQNNPDKMFLDAGAGMRPVYYRNVINLEIVNYWTTDIVASGEAIPFKEETFDGIFSVAVMEHVPNFFNYAENILRVLKKGGIMYCAVPFMQPEHGYPHHYYNMTHEGLLNLFRGRVSFKKTGYMQAAFHPLNSLRWFLDIYANGLLNKKEKEEFLRMRIEEILTMNEGRFQEIIHSANLKESEYRKICSGSFFLGAKN